MGRTYTSGLTAKGALILVPTSFDPLIVSNWSMFPRVVVSPWKAMLRAERRVHRKASLSFIAKMVYLMPVPTKQFVWPYLDDV